MHDIDQILLLFGMPEHIRAKSSGEVDTIAATLVYAQGLEVHLDGGWLEAETPFAMGFSVQSERAELEMTSDGLFRKANTGKREKVEAGNADAYESEIGYFIDCCRNGNPARALFT